MGADFDGLDASSLRYFSLSEAHRYGPVDSGRVVRDEEAAGSNPVTPTLQVNEYGRFAIEEAALMIICRRFVVTLVHRTAASCSRSTRTFRRVGPWRAAVLVPSIVRLHEQSDRTTTLRHASWQPLDKPFAHGTSIVITKPKTNFYAGVKGTMIQKFGKLFKHYAVSRSSRTVMASGSSASSFGANRSAARSARIASCGDLRSKCARATWSR
jgi:hypothetical protein